MSAHDVPMFFDRLNPTDLDPRQMVDRERDVRWLTEVLSRYLQVAGEAEGRAICVTGEKGVGKSILTRRVLEDLRADFSANTLFMTVDCRSCHERRGVLSAVANQAVHELASLHTAGARVPESLLATAQLLRQLSQLDRVELKVAHEQVRQFQLAARLGGRRSLLSALKLNFGVSLELTDREVKSLTGTVNFDDQGIGEALVAMFEDIRSQGFGCVLYLDNIDELRHEYRSAEERDRVRKDVEHVLELKRAPVALVLNMRKYYTGVVSRDISNQRVLRPVPPEVLREILARRLEEERPAICDALATPAATAVTERLSGIAPTPVAYLLWTKFLFEEGFYREERLAEGFDAYLETQYSNLDVRVLHALAAAFPEPDAILDASVVLEACAHNRAIFSQMQDRQVILPHDFWNPTQFKLDPELYFLHPKFGLFA
ncbi:MAG: ATP-binding protein [bacterium]